MAKFIEIQQSISVLDAAGIYKEIDHEPIFVNIERIETVKPQGKGCIIRLIGENNSIITDHSVVYVMGLINGAR